MLRERVPLSMPEVHMRCMYRASGLLTFNLRYPPAHRTFPGNDPPVSLDSMLCGGWCGCVWGGGGSASSGIQEHPHAALAFIVHTYSHLGYTHSASVCPQPCSCSAQLPQTHLNTPVGLAVVLNGSSSRGSSNRSAAGKTCSLAPGGVAGHMAASERPTQPGCVFQLLEGGQGRGDFLHLLLLNRPVVARWRTPTTHSTPRKAVRGVGE